MTQEQLIVKFFEEGKVEEAHKLEKYVSWYLISSRQTLSEEFMREFKDNVLWNWISIEQELRESFIREMKDRVDWLYISHSQDLSFSFILEFKDRVDWYNLIVKGLVKKDFVNNAMEKYFAKEE